MAHTIGVASPTCGPRRGGSFSAGSCLRQEVVVFNNCLGCTLLVTFDGRLAMSTKTTFCCSIVISEPSELTLLVSESSSIRKRWAQRNFFPCWKRCIPMTLLSNSTFSSSLSGEYCAVAIAKINFAVDHCLFAIAAKRGV